MDFIAKIVALSGPLWHKFTVLLSIPGCWNSGILPFLFMYKLGWSHTWMAFLTIRKCQMLLKVLIERGWVLSYPAHRGCHGLNSFSTLIFFIGLKQLVILGEAVISLSNTFVSKSMLSFSSLLLRLDRQPTFMFEANQGTCYDKKEFSFACLRKK